MDYRDQSKNLPVVFKKKKKSLKTTKRKKGEGKKGNITKNKLKVLNR